MTDGIVVSRHAGIGMGINFLGLTRLNLKALEHFMKELSPEKSPRSHMASLWASLLAVATCPVFAKANERNPGERCSSQFGFASWGATNRVNPRTPWMQRKMA